MGLLRKLFSKQQEPGDGSGGSRQPAPEGSAMIKTYDAQGREVFIPRHQWRDSILPRTLLSVRDDPEQLSLVLADAVREGFAAEVIPYAEHLWRSDPLPERGVTLLGNVYLSAGRLDDAERVLNDFTAAQGERAAVLAILAVVYNLCGDNTRAESILWRALELDPNQEGALGAAMALARERGGDTVEHHLLARVSMLPKSWRARLWLAQTELDEKNLSGALALYNEALTQAGQPAPVDLLFQMSGDLGQHGHFVEVIALAESPFDVTLHGLPTGNNLIKAHFELGQFGAARQILNQLKAQAQPDWLGALEYWEAELNKAEAMRRL